MDSRRVVYIRSTSDEADTVGSGYYLNERVILTCAHSLNTSENARIKIMDYPSDGPSNTTVNRINLADDVVLLVVEPCDDSIVGLGEKERSDSSKEPTRGLGGNQPVLSGLSNEVLMAEGWCMGYPEFQLQQLDPGDGSYRRDTALSGDFETGTGSGDGTMTFRIRPSQRPPAGPPGTSVFKGLSGAAIFAAGEELIGVVREDQQPDNPGTIVGSRLDSALARYSARATHAEKAAVAKLLGIPTLTSLPMATLSKIGWQRRASSLARARAMISNLPGGFLRDRGTELEEMAEFSVDENRSYFIWSAAEWAGKSSLLAAFVADPPGGVDVISHFINSTIAESRTASGFVDDVVGQLEALLPGSETAQLRPTQERLTFLLTRAVAESHARGRSLVLVVDGLDEDRTNSASRGTREQTIAELLPRNIARLHVIAATRPYAHILDDHPDHPIGDPSNRKTLSASPYAAKVREGAYQEVQYSCDAIPDTGPPVARDILGYLTVAGSALSLDDLTGLVNYQQPFGAHVGTGSVRAHLTNQLRRSTRRQPTGGISDLYDLSETFELSHGTIAERVRNQLGRTLETAYSERVDLWAEQHARDGWSATSPQYLESGYPASLARRGNIDSLVALALDRNRHAWLFSRLGSNDQALNDINAAMKLSDRSTGDTRAALAARLRYNEERLTAEPPFQVACLYARAGHHATALAIAAGYRHQGAQLGTLLALSETYHEMGEESISRQFLARAQLLALSQRGSDLAEALRSVVHSQVTIGDFDGATATANSIQNELILRDRDWALSEICEAQAWDNRIDDAVRTRASMIAEPLLDKAAASIARGLACHGRVDEAVQMAAAIGTPGWRQRALAGIARAQARQGAVEAAWDTVAEMDPGGDEQGRAMVSIAFAQCLQGDLTGALTSIGRIPDGRWRQDALAGVVVALADRDDLDGALTIRSSITDAGYSDEALAAIAALYVRRGELQVARELADSASSGWGRDAVLLAVATASAERADRQATVDTLRQVQVLNNDRQRALLHAKIARNQSRRGERAEAELNLMAAIRIEQSRPPEGTSNDRIRAEIARAQLELGHPDAATATASTVFYNMERSQLEREISSRRPGQVEALSGEVIEALLDELRQDA